MRKIKNNKTSPSDFIDGVSGEEVCDVFKNKYIGLYQKCKNNLIDNVVCKNNVDISLSCVNNRNVCKHLHGTNLIQIKNAVINLKGNNKEFNSSLTSNALKNGTDMLFLYLSFLFTVMISHGFSNDVFNTIIFNPILKNARKNRCDSDNYRAIALNSMFSKLLDYIVLDYFKEELCSSDFQFAYKSDFSTTLCTFLVKETIEYYINNNSNVFATFLDCSKAFDCVKHDKLFEILMNRGICPLIIRLLINLYINMRGVVKWNSHYSEEFEVYNGIKQGGVLSPTLFSLYIDELVKMVHGTKLGCYVGNLPSSSIFVYADDIVLLSPTHYGMRNLISICENFCYSSGLMFNPDKCVSMFFNKDSKDYNLNEFLINNCAIRFVDKFKHLGHEIKSNSATFLIESILSDIKSKTNGILNNFNFAAFDTKMKLFTSYCNSYYGSILCTIHQLDKVNTTWKVCLRKVLNLNPRTRSYLLPAISNSLNAKAEIEKRMLTFFIQGFNHCSYTIKSYFLNCLTEQCSTMFTNINILLRQNSIMYSNFLKFSRSRIKTIFKEKVESDWRTVFVKELLQVLENKMQVFQFDPGLIVSILKYVCTF